MALVLFKVEHPCVELDEVFRRFELADESDVIPSPVPQGGGLPNKIGVVFDKGCV